MPLSARLSTFVAGLALLLSCESAPFAPDPGSYYVLTSMNGVRPPVPLPPVSPGDSTAYVLLGEQFYVASDSVITYYRWVGQAHQDITGTVTYTCADAFENVPFFYHLRGDTLVLTPADPAFLAHPVIPPAPLVRHGSYLRTDDGAVRRHYALSRRLRLTCPS
jgi:hypothetical protein